MFKKRYDPPVEVLNFSGFSMQFAKIAFITARIIASIDCSDCWRYVALYWDFTVPGSESRFVSICPLRKAALRINWTVIVFAYIARRTRPNIVIRTLLTMLDTHKTLLETRHSPLPPFWVERAPTRFNICCSPEVLNFSGFSTQLLKLQL